MDTPQEHDSDRAAQRPLIFISHDSRDAQIARAFCDLIEKSSLGILETFCSSDRTGRGIEYGSQWFTTILDRLSSASEVVCLLTPLSMNRPWILYEAGVASGKRDTPVLGVVLGLSLSRANDGPFAQLQNCSGEPESIATLVTRMVKRLIPQAQPNQDLIQSQADVFVNSIAPLLKGGSEDTTARQVPKAEGLDSTLAAQLLEEIKEIANSLPSRLEERFPRSTFEEISAQLRAAAQAADEVRQSTNQTLKGESKELHDRIDEIHTIVEDHLGKIPAISALMKCGILNIYEDRPSAEGHILEMLSKAKDHIEVIGISLRSLFQGGGRLNKAILDVLADAAESKRQTPKWRVMVLDPECDQARYRSEREEPKGTNLEEGNLHREVNLTIQVVDNWRKRGCNIELRAYKGSPSCFLMIIDNTIFVEQYHYGRAGGARVAELVPLLEFISDSNTYRELLGHFDYMWKSLSRAMPRKQNNRVDHTA